MPIADLSLAAFLDALGSKTPTPGGGAAACITGAIASAQADMVVRYSQNRKDLAQHQFVLDAAVSALGAHRRAFLALADEDAVAYGAYSVANKLPPTDPARAGALAAATRACIDVPQRALQRALDLARLLDDLKDKTNRHLRSDLAIAADLCEASALSSRRNIEINLPNLPAQPQRDAVAASMHQSLDAIHAYAEAVRAACAP